MHSYSLDLRTHVVAAGRERGTSQAQVAERFGVSHTFVKKLLR